MIFEKPLQRTRSQQNVRRSGSRKIRDMYCCTESNTTGDKVILGDLLLWLIQSHISGVNWSIFNRNTVVHKRCLTEQRTLWRCIHGGETWNSEYSGSSSFASKTYETELKGMLHNPEKIICFTNTLKGGEAVLWETLKCHCYPERFSCI